MGPQSQIMNISWRQINALGEVPGAVYALCFKGRNYLGQQCSCVTGTQPCHRLPLCPQKTRDGRPMPEIRSYLSQ